MDKLQPCNLIEQLRYKVYINNNNNRNKVFTNNTNTAHLQTA